MHIQGNDKRETRVRTVPIFLAAAMAWLAALPGCMGAGDDAVVALAASDGGDAGDAKGAGDAQDGGDAKAVGDASRSNDAGNAGDAKASDAQTADATLGDASVNDGGSAGDATLADGPAVQASGGVAQFNPSPFDLGMIGCNSVKAFPFVIKNAGTSTLIIAATATTVDTAPGSFDVDPANLSISPGTSQSLSISATISSAATAGAVLGGSLALITTDRNNARASIPLSATAMGATIVLGGSALVTVTFPATKVGTSSPPVPFVIQNVGNAVATLTLGPLSGAAQHDFLVPSISGTGLKTDLAANGGEIRLSGTFTPSQAGSRGVTSTIAVSGVTCGPNSTQQVALQGTGTLGNIGGYPSTLDFQANCGGQAPAPLSFPVNNTGPVAAQVNAQIDPADAGFSVIPTTASVPGTSVLSPEGGTFTFQVSAPPFPPQTGDGGTEAGSMPTSRHATLNLTSDSTAGIPDGGLAPISLTEHPEGASLVFAAGSSAASQGIVLNAAVGATAVQSIGVVNKGTGPTPAVTLTLVPTGPPDAGGEAGSPADASVVAGSGSLTFDQGAAASQLQVPPGAQGASAKITFAPVAAGDSYANVVMSVDPDGLCAQVPKPFPVQGHGSGLEVGPTNLTFYATCDGTPVPSAKFTISNTLKDPLPWAIGAIAGPGAANYSVTDISVTDITTMATTPLPPPLMNMPRSLASTEIATVTVAVPQALPSAAATDGGAPWTAPSPDELAAWLNVDSPAGGALVLLNEIPIGDRLTVSLGSQNSVPITNMAFGPVAVGSSSTPQPFVVTNDANLGPSATYAGANVSITVSGDAAFGVAPAAPTSPLLAGSKLSESVVFRPTSAGARNGTIAIGRSSPMAPLCAPLPAPIALSGTGMQAAAVVDVLSYDFGPVNCGSASSTPKVFTVSHGPTSNLPFKVVSLTFANTSSPYAVQPAPDLSAPIAVGGSLAFTVVTKPVPTTGVDPGTLHVFDDDLKIATDIAGTITIPLTLEPQGAVIVDTVPTLRTTWNFGSVAFGSVGTIVSQIQNRGNAPATVSLSPVAPQLLPGVFDLASNPTSALPGVTTTINGQFTPSVAGSSWVGQATLTVTGALCQPLPTQWVSPTMQLSGNSM